MPNTVNNTFKRLFVYEGNLLAFGISYHVGIPYWDAHFKALTYAVEMGASGHVPSVTTVHAMLAGPITHDAGELRSTYHGKDYPEAGAVPQLVHSWRAVAEEVCQAKSFKVEQEAHKRILALHYDLMRIAPFNTDNARLARIMALSLCLYAEVDPIMFYYERRSEYVRALSC